MLALVTGARLEEIAQLLTHDIIEDPEYGLLMRITDEGDAAAQDDRPRRIVPLHPEILRAGFPDYVDLVRESGHKWLFLNCSPTTTVGEAGIFASGFSAISADGGESASRTPELCFTAFGIRS
ncbi:hypothetical protein [Thauera humireducens]|uniref:hypothetical protein n=1 Tax=Thauera humireducens TaxID=1134435 RepID=UPI00311F8B0D